MATEIIDLEARISTANTIAGLRELRKEVKGALEHFVYGTPEFNRHQQGLHTLNNRYNDLTHGGLSNLGQAMRSNTMVAMNFGRILQDLPFGLMAVANNIDPLVLSLQSLKKEADAAGVSMKTALLGAFTGPGGLLAVVGMVSIGFTLLPKLLKATRDASYDTALALSKLNYEMGKFTFNERLDALGKMKEKTQDFVLTLARRRATMSFLGVPIPGAPSPEDIARAQLDANRAAQEYELFLRGEPPKEPGGVRAATGGGMEYTIDPSAERSAMVYDRYGYPRSGAVTGLPASGVSAPQIPGRLYGIPGSQQQDITRPILQMKTLTDSLIQSLNVGVMSVANSIRTQVGMAWVKVFGEANSLLEIFAQNVISTLAGALAQSFMSGLVGSISGIGEAYSIVNGLVKPSFVGGGYKTVQSYNRNSTSAYKRGFYGY